MKKTATSIVICLLLSLIFIAAAREAGAAKIYVENVDTKVNCDYDVAIWITDTDGTNKKIKSVYLTRGNNYTFDTEGKTPYMLDGSVCKASGVTVATGRYLMRRWFSTITGDSNWKIEVCDDMNSQFTQKP